MKKYILVLDLDETLVHYKEGYSGFSNAFSYKMNEDAKLKVRPGVQHLLETLDPYYHFVVFTAAMKQYADFVIRKIDPMEKFIKCRFYRNSCKSISFFQVKDLNIVIRVMGKRFPRLFETVTDPLSKVIIVDNIRESF